MRGFDASYEIEAIDATTLTVNDGGAPDFLAINDNPIGGDGYTNVIPPGQVVTRFNQNAPRIGMPSASPHQS